MLALGCLFPSVKFFTLIDEFYDPTINVTRHCFFLMINAQVRFIVFGFKKNDENASQWKRSDHLYKIYIA